MARLIIQILYPKNHFCNTKIDCNSSHINKQYRNNVNILNTIKPFKTHTWVFNDERTGLVEEPFVLGIETMIDIMVKDIANAEHGFNLIFSSAPFPKYQLKLDWLREEDGGNWYFSSELSMEGWLCPALLLYFDTAPENIFIMCSELAHNN